MTRLRWLVARLRALTSLSGRERDLEAELQFHLEEDAEDARAEGMAPDAARRDARRRLGNVALVREDMRAVWTWGTAERLFQDVRFSLRVLVRQRAFTATALATIVLIVGGTTTVFTLVYGVLLRPLPYPDAERLAVVRADDPEVGTTSLSLAEVQRLREAVPAFGAWGLYRPGYGTRLDRDSDAPLMVQDMRITPELFPLLGIRVVLGRPVVAADQEDANPLVAVIGHDLWQSKFGGAPDVIGKSVEVRPGRTVTIVGVADAGADVPANRIPAPMVWSPVRVSERDMRFSVLARLRPGHSIDGARAALAGVPPMPDPRTGVARPLTATRLIDHIAGDNQRILWVFFGAVGCVLLIGIANLVSLQLVRNTSRAQELGVRAALGAGRWRLTRQLVVESLLDAEVSMQMYAPIGQLPGSARVSAILLRATPGTQAVAERSTAVLRTLERDLVSVDVSSLADVRWTLVAAERFRTTVLGVFAATAMFLALVGIFGLVAYTVTQRTREIGLRVALGATGAGVAALMARHALVPALIGMAAGLAGAIAASRLVASFLFEIQPTDPATFASAIGLFAAAIVIASLVPALRSGHVNPADVLRHE